MNKTREDKRQIMKGLKMDTKTIEFVKIKIVNDVPNLMKSDLVEIILFGSCARGDYCSDSDIDIALITKCNREEVKKYDDGLDEIATEIAMKYYSIVNFVCFPETEFHKNKTWYALFKNISKEGIRLYG